MPGEECSQNPFPEGIGITLTHFPQGHKDKPKYDSTLRLPGEPMHLLGLFTEIGDSKAVTPESLHLVWMMASSLHVGGVTTSLYGLPRDS